MSYKDAYKRGKKLKKLNKWQETCHKKQRKVLPIYVWLIYIYISASDDQTKYNNRITLTCDY